MVYLLETKLSENKSLVFALQNIYGIGKHHSILLCKKLGFSINLKVKDLSNFQIMKLLKLVDVSNLIINTDLKKLQILVLKKLIYIKSYKGLRMIRGLPIRGQRTHTNAKTARKNRR